MSRRATVVLLVVLAGNVSAGKPWPVATITGEVSVERGTKPPVAIAGTIIDAGKKDASEHAVPCSLTERAWRCSVPAEHPLHLRLVFDDFAPVYVWDIAARDAEVDTGVHTLARGASVVGRVLGEQATLALIPMTAAHQPAADRAVTSLRTKTDARGWFRFVSVPPGRYRLISKMAGRADAVREVEVNRGRELRLAEPLLHPALAELEVLVTPPVTKAGRQWRVALKRPGERMSEMVRAAEGTAGVDGVWTHGGLQPGAYLLIVSDAGSEVTHQLVELRGGLERVPVAISAIDVRGRIVSGGKPVEATVRFDYIDANGRRVEAETDEDGHFGLTFPIAGEWRPSVFVNAVELKLPPVTIRSPHEEEVLLDLPGGRLEATVLDADGATAPAALLLQRDGETVSSGLTDDDGKIELFGLEPGAYTAQAEAEHGFAGPIPVTIEKDEVTELELRVSPIREVTGQVLTSDGLAASGAIVRTLDDVTRSYEDTIADGRGVYSFRVKPGVDSIDMIVLAPPHPLALRRIQVGAKRTSAPPIVLARTGAMLRVVPSGSIPPWPMLQAPHGRSYPLVLLLAPRFGQPWRELVNGTFQFSVEPGAYVLCSPDSKCKSTLLAPNAEMLITFEETS